MFKSAFITILGLPNAGKSTFLNSVLGENLVITNAKAQTTRHRIKGILNGENHQLVFSDTPGIIHEAAYKLQDAMMTSVDESIYDADVVLLLLDAQYLKLEAFSDLLPKIKCPIVVALNKVDLVLNQNQVIEAINEVKKVVNTEDVFAMSALNSFNTEGIISKLIELAPEHPAYYDRESITDENVRFLVSEMVREQMLTQFKKEIPYSVEILVTGYEEGKNLDRIEATIYVERDSQKVIVIGRGGASIKRLGTESRKKIEAFIHKKVFLGLSVKVKKDWRKDDLELKRFGYIRK